MEKWPSPRALTLAVFAVLAAGCSDRGPTAARFDPVTPSESGAYRCEVDVRSARMTCAQSGGGVSNIILGGQGIYVTLASSNVAYDAGTGDLTADVTVTNLIPQPLGTLDGVTGSPAGVRVFFPAPPQTTSGSGVVTVVPDGFGNFLGSNEPYFAYAGADLSADGILVTSETSAARTWTFNFPATVTTFSFGVYVHADVPNPTGWVSVSPGTTNVMQGDAAQFTGVVNSAVGNPVAGASIAWGTSDNAIATISGTGLLSAAAPGAVKLRRRAAAAPQWQCVRRWRWARRSRTRPAPRPSAWAARRAARNTRS